MRLRLAFVRLLFFLRSSSLERDERQIRRNKFLICLRVLLLALAFAIHTADAVNESTCGVNLQNDKQVDDDDIHFGTLTVNITNLNFKGILTLYTYSTVV